MLPPRPEKQDNVTLPEHYARFKIEPIRFITENGLNFLQGCIVKYVLRYDAKNGLEDLRKARRCIDMLIKHVDGDPDFWKAPQLSDGGLTPAQLEKDCAEAAIRFDTLSSRKGK